MNEETLADQVQDALYYIDAHGFGVSEHIDSVLLAAAARYVELSR